MSLRIFDDLNALSHAAAELVVLRGRDAIRDRGEFHFALAGGSTPKTLYSLLASEPYRDYLSWELVHVYWGDERWVGSSDPQSNELTGRQFLLDLVPIPALNVYPIFSDGMNAEENAQNYESVLKINAPNGMDLVLLGMGDDGHIASLFPNGPELLETEKWVMPTTSPKGVSQRISMTLPYLKMSKCVLFMVSGADKAPALQLALGSSDADWPPAGILGHAIPDVTHWYVDEAAFRS